MMKAKFLLFLTLSFVLAACTDKAYDLDKLSREMTFFENEISIPVGSLGPITAESLLGDILKSLELETSRDGYLLAHSTEDFFELSAYELALKAPDPSQPFVYDCGSVSYSVEGAAAIVSITGLGLTDQKIKYTVFNPLSAPVTLNAVSSVSCFNMRTYETSYESEVPLENVTLPARSRAFVLQEIALPDHVMDYPGGCYLDNLTLEVPGDIVNKIRSSSPNFIFTGAYSSHVCIREGVEFQQSGFPVEGLRIPLGRLGFREVVLKFNLENSLPLDVNFDHVKILLPEEERESHDSKIDENIEVSGPIFLAGGTLDKPGVTPVSLRIKAKEGAIPDITGIVFDFHVKTAPDCIGSLLSVKQGISIQSASVSICGGIKLFGDE